LSKTTEAAKVLCPRTCGDCCCEPHHWGALYGDDSGETIGCKHCEAAVDLEEKCVRCGKELIDHDFDGDWSGEDCKGEKSCPLYPWSPSAQRRGFKGGYVPAKTKQNGVCS